MAMLQLVNRMSADFLVLPGSFLDCFLPSCRGDDLKVFLYLLRQLNRADGDFSMASAADALDLPQQDLLRSLTYWEKAGLLQLSFNSDHILEAISVLDIDAAAKETLRRSRAVPDQALPGQAKSARASVTQTSSAGTAALAAADTRRNDPGRSASSASTASSASPASAPDLTKAPAAKPVPRDLTPKELSALDSDLDFQAFVFMVEQSLGTLMKPDDVGRLGYWYINFNRSTEILEALLEYCATQCAPGSPSLKYLDAVAAGWFSEGISSADQAQEYSAFRNSLVTGIMKAFGLKSRRDPNPDELELIRRWTKEYGFSKEMILRACTKTAANVSTNQFSYAEGILSSWFKEGIRTPAEADAADLQYRKSQSAAKHPVEISRSARQFHNFEERDTDYEKLLLNQMLNDDSSESTL